MQSKSRRRTIRHWIARELLDVHAHYSTDPHSGPDLSVRYIMHDGTEWGEIAIGNVGYDTVHGMGCGACTIDLTTPMSARDALIMASELADEAEDDAWDRYATSLRA